MEEDEGLVKKKKKRKTFSIKSNSNLSLTFSKPLLTLSSLQIFPAVAGEDEDDVKSIHSHRMKMEISGHSLEESMEECRVEEMSVHKVSSRISSKS